MKVFVVVSQDASDSKKEHVSLEVSSEATLTEFKQLIAKDFSIPVHTQKIVADGITLSEDLKLGEYGILDESRIVILKKKDEEKDTTVLHDAVYRYLRQYYNEADSLKVTKQFMIQFYQNIATLSLDDIERLCASFLHDEETLK